MRSVYVMPPRHIAPRGTYRRAAALATWNGTRLSEEQALADAIGRITANFEKPRLAVVTGEAMEQERDPTKWRRRQHDNLNRQRANGCDRCKGTAEMSVMSMYGEYEGTEPCWVCQRANPFDSSEPNERPF